MTIAATTGKFAGQSKGVTCLGQHPTKLFIGGISKNTTTEVLRRHFCRYGRVLDCVAIRREDGSPRGFGYVTLDSVQAADCCLAQPQVIDGRVVDLKHAVPEGRMEIAQKAAGPRVPGLSARKQQNPMALLSTPAPLIDIDSDILSTASPMMWPVHSGLAHWATALNESYTENSPDCMELLSTTPTQQGARPALLSTQPVHLEQWQAECSQGASEHGSNVLSASAPEFIPHAESTDKACKEDLPKRAALGDITNTQGQSALSKISNSLKKKLPPPVQIFTDESMMHSAGMLSPPGLSPQDADLSLLADNANDEAKGADYLPSIGSLGHAAGTCKRCNFFVKGRCQNGKSCSFCHFPHDKPKMKRDRAELSPAGAQETMAYPLPAAGPPGLTLQTVFAESVPTVPVLWQTEEVSTPNSSALMTPLQGCALLSTTPMASQCTSLPTRKMSEDSPAAPEKASACTQTEEAKEAEEADGLEMSPVQAPCISREDLLRLRPVCDASNLGIRTVKQ
eukprot:TRINITY_DN73465_c0_g1_i1.p1 TRINITY_DN73465_c0_g1~~TRINITY_DN73465_c0_g1_i1.p1  ORF type:complete len:535 (-),score=109.55 TRINITY_DN73465_c0_g1_i1:70-1599(-)